MIRRRRGQRDRRGLSLVEVLLGLALLGIVLTKLGMVVSETHEAHRRESVSMALEDQASTLLDRIAYAIVGSRADNLDPGVAPPFSTESLSYQVSLGVEDGEVVLSDPEIIALRDGAELYWGQNVGEAGERIVVWSRTVSELLEDELFNGADDNANGIQDELGLSFVVQDASVTIRLTLERTDADGQVTQVTKETRVTCRN